ncbi:hypothetical protein F5Y17DRAFT_252916 [Xylariaceae sp. FL0594]|nr:hypothetical protein F5Y17DRAFT_252916 [Xylariaceae sp. FL0594]
MDLPNGALRITRTAGRKDAKNCVNLKDIIHKEQLVSACIFSFFTKEDEFYQHLPLSKTSEGIPVNKYSLVEIQTWTPFCGKHASEQASDGKNRERSHGRTSKGLFPRFKASIVKSMGRTYGHSLPGAADAVTRRFFFSYIPLL